jgi:hypothetical protein
LEDTIMPQQITDKTVRAEVYDTVAQAERAVDNLLHAGFTKEEIGVFCSDKYKERFFPNISKTVQSGGKPGASAAAGGAIGASIGGLALAATSLATGGATLLAAGMVLVAGGAIAGTFAGTMATFGYEPEVAEQYEQAIQQGKILITVQVIETPDEHNAERVAVAQRILSEAKRVA